MLEEVLRYSIILIMNTQDILGGFLVVGLIVVVVCFVYIAYYLVEALKSITKVADDLDEATQSIKNRIQLKALAAIPALLVGLVSKVIRRKRG